MKIMTKNKLDELYTISTKFYEDEINKYSIKSPLDPNTKFHYAPLETVFKILETDSIRLTNSRFSNDESEEKMLGKEWGEDYNADNYIFCVCDNGDQLSQWRGYCPNGGAAIGLSMNKALEYSILFANDEIQSISSLNRPIPVVYSSADDSRATLIRIKNKLASSSLEISDIIPYIKNDQFYEEKESRLVFSNIEHDYDACIRFRSAENNIKIPYILVKFGHTEKELVPATFDFADKAVEHFINSRTNTLELTIPQGNNQEKIYNIVKKKYKQLREKARWAYPKINIYCEGHLPVKTIYVAPTYDRDRTVESVKRFCESHYWLSEVDVKASKIPFIPPIR